MYHITGNEARGVKSIFQKFIELFRWNDSRFGYTKADLPEILEQARKEWQHAKLYFNNVTDPDLIDHAIFYMGATEKKYIYLLKRAREIGLNIERLNLGD